ncbi:MAG: hypothetical protein B7Z58_08770 [Acidiphilium sp. 37-64-53]|uniref:hypothetical protein n=1 Tax=Acidiphilium rubrum TaxID=526 RepID=UPI000BD26B77|nr:hypothetical protein [Acidiphilium rubrum]OYW02185.1 MAG: hypothetical protein B7Z58_08770 [Acidiphilium sp. 37-64-53]OZB22792.1 MAG: hypothetical protein B7X49_16740 [Acidiphilium sp. 34-64-41]
MDNNALISALIVKRNEAERDIVALKKRVTARRSELHQIDCAIKVLTPSLRTARLIATRHARSRLVVSGELSRRCQDALREAEGAWITAEEIARIPMRAEGLSPDDTEMRRDFTRRPLWTLNRFVGRDAVEKEGWGTAARWRALSK